MSPTCGNGKICYLELPAFDAVAACDAVVAHGGAIVQPIGVDAPEITARFSDPAGNILGVYQEPGGTGSA